VAIRGILFDKDGTLIDFARTWVPINRDAALFAAGGDQALADGLLRRHGQDPATGAVTAGSVLAAGSIYDIAEAFAADLGERTPPDLAAAIDRIYAEGGARHAVLIDGAQATLAALKRRGFRLGVATNDSIGGLEASLGRFPEALALFDFRTGCDSGFGAKPEPGMVLGFCRAVGILPSEVAMVGDAVHDLAMGRAAGAGLNVGVLSGTSAEDDFEGLADLILPSINELPARRELLAR
jgi:phosphoglycolate phosphatase